MRQFSKGFWLLIAILAVPVDYLSWNLRMPAKGFRRISLAEAWKDGMGAWRKL